MTTNKELFAKHVHLSTFCETGTCFGRSVQMALDVGFKEVLSVEADLSRYEHCLDLFRENRNVVLWHGRSDVMLPRMIDTQPDPMLFFLDAHPSGEGSYGQDFDTVPEHHQSNVLQAELTIIHERDVPGDVILIDDLTPDVNEFARKLFPKATFNLHSVEDGADKVLEVLT